MDGIKGLVEEHCDGEVLEALLCSHLLGGKLSIESSMNNVFYWTVVVRCSGLTFWNSFFSLHFCEMYFKDIWGKKTFSIAGARLMIIMHHRWSSLFQFWL